MKTPVTRGYWGSSPARAPRRRGSRSCLAATVSAGVRINHGETGNSVHPGRPFVRDFQGVPHDVEDHEPVALEPRGGGRGGSTQSPGPPYRVWERGWKCIQPFATYGKTLHELPDGVLHCTRARVSAWRGCHAKRCRADPCHTRDAGTTQLVSSSRSRRPRLPQSHWYASR